MTITIILIATLVASTTLTQADIDATPADGEYLVTALPGGEVTYERIDLWERPAPPPELVPTLMASRRAKNELPAN